MRERKRKILEWKEEREDETERVRERIRAKESGNGIESRIARFKIRQAAVKRRGERISKREQAFAEKNKKRDLERKDGNKKGQGKIRKEEREKGRRSELET